MDLSEVLPGVQIGQVFGPFPLVVDADLNEQYLFALRDFHPRYLHGSNENAPLVHPGVLLNASMTMVMNLLPGKGWTGFHGRDEVEWFEPAYVDEPMEISYEMIDLIEKRERPWWIREARITNSSGGMKLRRRFHIVFVRDVK